MEDLILTDSQLDDVLESFNETLAIINDLEALGDSEMSMQDALAIDADHGSTVAMESYSKAYTASGRYQVAMESLLDTLKNAGIKVIEMVRKAIRKLLSWIKELYRQHKGNSSKKFPRELDVWKYPESLIDIATAEVMAPLSKKFINGLSQNELSLLDNESLKNLLKPITAQLLQNPIYWALPKEIEQATKLYEQSFKSEEKQVETSWEEFKDKSGMLDPNVGAYADLKSTYEKIAEHREEVSKNRLSSWLGNFQRISRLIYNLDEFGQSPLFEKLEDQIEAISAIDKALADADRRFKSHLPTGEVTDTEKANIRNFSEVINQIGHRVQLVARGMEILHNVRRQTYMLLAKLCKWAADVITEQFTFGRPQRTSKGTLTLKHEAVAEYIVHLQEASARYHSMV